MFLRLLRFFFICFEKYGEVFIILLAGRFFNTKTHEWPNVYILVWTRQYDIDFGINRFEVINDDNIQGRINGGARPPPSRVLRATDHLINSRKLF